MVALSIGALGLLIANKFYGQNFKLRLPVDANRLDEVEVKSTRGWMYVWIGMGTIVVGVIFSVISEYSMALCLLEMIVGVSGVLVGGVSETKGPISIGSFDDEFIWIKGAEKQFVMQFEPLPARNA